MAEGVSTLDRVSIRELDIAIGDEIVLAIVRESARTRRLRMTVRAGGPVELTVPRRTSTRALRAFIDENSDWLGEKIAAARLERDDHWLPLKSALLAESECLPTAETAAHVIGLEEGIGTADRLSDDAVLNADRLAKHAAALKNGGFNNEVQRVG